MTYTTQGLMTPADITDYEQQHDLHLHPDCPGHGNSGWVTYCTAAVDCPGESTGSGGGPRVCMGTYERLTMYLARSASGKLTPAQRRRLVKKAGRTGDGVVVRDDGMGYPPSMQGYKELITGLPVPVSGAPY